ncbi:MAG: hypothetical protein FWE37_06545 [Spirochaetaceae bacterium]|nr:hypothetical protein [Spirochaetaceae bacterium]
MLAKNENNNQSAGRKKRGGKVKYKKKAADNTRREHYAAPKKEHEPLYCASCKLEIKEVMQAIGLGASGQAAHFDCVLKELNAREQLAEGEKIIYLGGGGFAVITEIKGKAGSFVIKRRINYEEKTKELIEVWRKEYAITPSFIIASSKIS